MLADTAAPQPPRPASAARPKRVIPMAEFFQRIGYVTLKLTRGCNLSCSYCNVEADTPRTPRMALAVYKRVADLLVGKLAPTPGRPGVPRRRAAALAGRVVRGGRRLRQGPGARHRKDVEFPLVTNATLLTEERLLRLKALGIRFCLSVDGPPDINDQVRGGGQAVERAVRLLVKHRVRFGVLSVMSRANYQHMGKVMDWFREVGITNFRVNFLEAQGRGNDEQQLLRGEEMFEGMKQVLDHLDRTGLSVSEGEMMMMVRRFLYGRDPKPQLSCWEYQCQAGRSYVTVDLDGILHACGTDVVHHPLGHLDQDMDLDHYDTTLLRLHDKGDWVIRCFDCDAKKICRHSCSTSDFNSKNQREYECRFTKLMYRHLCENPDQAARVEGIALAHKGCPLGPRSCR